MEQGHLDIGRMAMIDQELHLAIRELQLPTRLEDDSHIYQAIWMNISHNGSGEPSDVAIDLKEAIAEWSEKGGNPPQIVVEAIEAGLTYYDDEDSLPMDYEGYIEAYKSIRKGHKRDWRGLDHSTAVHLLSRTRLISYLISVEHFSTSQVKRYFEATESSLSVPYKAIQCIAKELGIKPELDLVNLVPSMWKIDRERAKNIFADAELIESCDIAADYISRWDAGSRVALQRYLKTMVDEGVYANEISWPYFQILHWCTTPLEFYDHPASYLYEFGPRSAGSMEVVLGPYPTVTGNPVLNNAKAVSRFDHSWANNRSAPDAHALVGILEILESVPFAARRDIARIIRSWLIHLIDVLETDIVEFPEVDSFNPYSAVVEGVCSGETYTAGVIEQRVVDALGVLAFRPSEYVPRGLGDSVNASNLSRKKLGDIEFADVSNLKAIAIEAHGGMLSQSYVSAHQKSLARVLEVRLSESWLALASAEKWHVDVIFVAHGRSGSLIERESIHGVNVDYTYIDYYEFRDMAFSDASEEQAVEVFDSLFRREINSTCVRQTVRNTARRMAGLSV